VYFVATTDKVDTVPQESEVVAVEWVRAENAISLLAHRNDKRVLSMALEYIDEKQKLAQFTS
jgi:hypothetical protein